MLEEACHSIICPFFCHELVGVNLWANNLDDGIQFHIQFAVMEVVYKDLVQWGGFSRDSNDSFPED